MCIFLNIVFIDIIYMIICKYTKIVFISYIYGNV